MNNVATLLDLADRVEAASGPDDRLDYDIAAELSEWRNCGGWVQEHKVTGESRKFTHRAPPAYTASLDAALTLVPEGWFTFYATEDRHSHSWRWQLRGDFGHIVTARAATPALALTAAALRAIHHVRAFAGKDDA